MKSLFFKEYRREYWYKLFDEKEIDRRFEGCRIMAAITIASLNALIYSWKHNKPRWIDTRHIKKHAPFIFNSGLLRQYFYWQWMRDQIIKKIRRGDCDRHDN